MDKITFEQSVKTISSLKLQLENLKKEHGKLVEIVEDLYPGKDSNSEVDTLYVCIRRGSARHKTWKKYFLKKYREN